MCLNYDKDSRSRINILGGGVYNHLMSTKIFNLTVNKIFISMSSKNYKESGYSLTMDLLTILYRSMCVHIIEKVVN